MAQKILFIGDRPNDGTGLVLREAFDKVNLNFTEIYGAFPLDPVTGNALPVAPVNDPVFTGDPQAPTPPTNDNDTSIATTEFVKNQNYLTQAGAAAGYQPLDPDLTALANVPYDDEFYYRVGSGNWQRVLMGSNITFDGGTLSVVVSGGGGLGNVSSVGTPLVGQFAQWASATTIQGVSGAGLGFAPINSPTFTGDPRSNASLSPTDDDTSLATTAFVKSTVNASVINPSAGQCGRLMLKFPNELQYLPYNGDRLKIAGVNRQIPAGGVEYLNKDNCYVGTSNILTQLEMGKSYIVTAEMSSDGSQMIGRFWPVSSFIHMPSQNVGNLGTEIIQNHNEASVIGLCYVNNNVASQIFRDDYIFRGVFSWFNRRDLHIVGPFTGNTISNGMGEINANARIICLSWREQSQMFMATGEAYNDCSTANRTCGLAVGVDGVADNDSVIFTNVSANLDWRAITSHAPVSLLEGAHIISPHGGTVLAGGNAHFGVRIRAVVRG